MIQEFKAPKIRKFDMFGLLSKWDLRKTGYHLREINRAEEATRDYLKYLQDQRTEVLKYRVKAVKEMNIRKIS